jgi:pyruvate-formate lyase-activating enzyme
MTEPPRLLLAVSQGKIVDHPRLSLAGRAGRTVRAPREDELIPLPPGSELFVLPGRRPVGLDVAGRPRVIDSRRGRPVRAVAAFVAPAHTLTLLAAWRRLPGAPVLPLFAYGAVGFRQGRFYVCARRVDPDRRQDPDRFDPDLIRRRAGDKAAELEGNRLARHLIENCALTYGCPAARNFVLGRDEAPLPTSRVCNAACLGCLSEQAPGSPICVTQPRLTFTPTAAEVAGVAVGHLRTAPRAVASFGQGCEGEPLLNADLLAESIRLIRRETSRGTINLNTNASRPKAVAALAQAGLDSLRVSLNSLVPAHYEAYYRPRGYGLEDVRESITAMKRAGRFVSLNLLYLPGVTDLPSQAEPLARLVSREGVDLIQLRNLNIDPDYYLEHVGEPGPERPLGLAGLMDRLTAAAPGIDFGYFNPCLDPGAGGALDP